MPIFEFTHLKIQSHKNLLTLNLSHNDFSNQSLSPLISLLKKSHVLENLDLSHCSLDRYFAIKLARTFYFNPQLESLILNNNNLGDLGVTVIVRYIKHLKALRNLNLSNNNSAELGTYFADEAFKISGRPHVYQI